MDVPLVDFWSHLKSMHFHFISFIQFVSVSCNQPTVIRHECRRGGYRQETDLAALRRRHVSPPTGFQQGSRRDRYIAAPRTACRTSAGTTDWRRSRAESSRRTWPPASCWWPLSRLLRLATWAAGVSFRRSSSSSRTARTGSPLTDRRATGSRLRWLWVSLSALSLMISHCPHPDSPLRRNATMSRL